MPKGKVNETLHDSSAYISACGLTSTGFETPRLIAQGSVSAYGIAEGCIACCHPGKIASFIHRAHLSLHWTSVLNRSETCSIGKRWPSEEWDWAAWLHRELPRFGCSAGFAPPSRAESQLHVYSYPLNVTTLYRILIFSIRTAKLYLPPEAPHEDGGTRMCDAPVTRMLQLWQLISFRSKLSTQRNIIKEPATGACALTPEKCPFHLWMMHDRNLGEQQQ